SGGNGGTGGSGNSYGGLGAAGTGIVGSGLTIINSGSISGGGFNAQTRANAITFTGGANALTLQGSSWSLAGNIEIDGNGSITFNQTTDQTLGNIIAGNGSITQN